LLKTRFSSSDSVRWWYAGWWSGCLCEPGNRREWRV